MSEQTSDLGTSLANVATELAGQGDSKSVRYAAPRPNVGARAGDPESLKVDDSVHYKQADAPGKTAALHSGGPRTESEIESKLWDDVTGPITFEVEDIDQIPIESAKMLERWMKVNQACFESQVDGAAGLEVWERILDRTIDRTFWNEKKGFNPRYRFDLCVDMMRPSRKTAKSLCDAFSHWREQLKEEQQMIIDEGGREEDVKTLGVNYAASFDMAKAVIDYCNKPEYRYRPSYVGLPREWDSRVQPWRDLVSECIDGSSTPSSAVHNVTHSTFDGTQITHWSKGCSKQNLSLGTAENILSLLTDMSNWFNSTKDLDEDQQFYKDTNYLSKECTQAATKALKEYINQAQRARRERMSKTKRISRPARKIHNKRGVSHSTSDESFNDLFRTISQGLVDCPMESQEENDVTGETSHGSVQRIRLSVEIVDEHQSNEE